MRKRERESKSERASLWQRGGTSQEWMHQKVAGTKLLFRAKFEARSSPARMLARSAGRPSPLASKRSKPLACGRDVASCRRPQVPSAPGVPPPVEGFFEACQEKALKPQTKTAQSSQGQACHSAVAFMGFSGNMWSSTAGRYSTSFLSMSVFTLCQLPNPETATAHLQT